MLEFAPIHVHTVLQLAALLLCCSSLPRSSQLVEPVRPVVVRLLQPRWPEAAMTSHKAINDRAQNRSSELSEGKVIEIPM